MRAAGARRHAIAVSAVIVLMAGAVLLTAPPPPDARLAAALAPLLRQNPGRLAAAITDPATGFTATYHSDMALTTTTVTGQLRLLTDLTSARSPLSAPARHYELTLMSNVDPGQDWGVTAAASPGTRPAVKNGRRRRRSSRRDGGHRHLRPHQGLGHRPGCARQHLLRGHRAGGAGLNRYGSGRRGPSASVWRAAPATSEEAS